MVEAADGAGESEGSSRAKGLGITATLAAFLFLLLRLLAVSHYDWPTAFALADTVDFDDALGVVIGTFLGASTLSAVLLAVVLPLLVLHYVRQVKRGTRLPGRSLVIFALSGLFVAALISFRIWPALLIVLAVTGVLWVIAVRRGPAEGLVTQIVARLGAVLLAAVLLLAAVADTVWVPKERLDLRDGSLVGYVMVDEPGFLKVLTYDEREIRILPLSDVLSRTELHH